MTTKAEVDIREWSVGNGGGAGLRKDSLVASIQQHFRLKGYNVDTTTINKNLMLTNPHTLEAVLVDTTSAQPMFYVGSFKPVDPATVPYAQPAPPAPLRPTVQITRAMPQQPQPVQLQPVQPAPKAQITGVALQPVQPAPKAQITGAILQPVQQTGRGTIAQMPLGSDQPKPIGVAPGSVYANLLNRFGNGSQQPPKPIVCSSPQKLVPTCKIPSPYRPPSDICDGTTAALQVPKIVYKQEQFCMPSDMAILKGSHGGKKR